MLEVALQDMQVNNYQTSVSGYDNGGIKYVKTKNYSWFLDDFDGQPRLENY